MHLSNPPSFTYHPTEPSAAVLASAPSAAFNTAPADTCCCFATEVRGPIGARLLVVRSTAAAAPRATPTPVRTTAHMPSLTSMIEAHGRCGAPVPLPPQSPRQ